MNDILDTPWKDSVLLEMEVAKIIRQQELNGWLFDKELAIELISRLESDIKKIDNEILPKLPWRKITYENPTIENPFRKDGKLLDRVSKYFKDQSDCVCGPFSKITWEQLNLNSEDQLKEYFLSLGWKPREWNMKKVIDENGRKSYVRTSPKMDEESIDEIGNIITDGLGKLISNRMVMSHRLSQIKGFLRNVREDGRIEARANTMGTPTARMRHSIVVNVPKNKPHVFLGKEMRSLFIVSPGYKQVGVDAKGLENRMIAHYVNRSEVTKMLTQGDFHSIFQEAISRFASNRDIAKNVEYAYFFGAMNPKLADTADINPPGMTKDEIGQSIRDCISYRIPGLNELIENVKKTCEYRSYLKGLDGRRLIPRSTHSAFNLLIQSSGAIVMKWVLVILNQMIIDHKLDVKFVGNFHDELQMECNEKDVDKLLELCYNVFHEVTNKFKLNCPLEGDPKVGNNWAECH